MFLTERERKVREDQALYVQENSKRLEYFNNAIFVFYIYYKRKRTNIYSLNTQ